MVCIGTGYTRRKFGDFLGLSKLERCVGCIEGQKGGMMALSGLYSVSIGAGYWRGKLGRKFNRKSSIFEIFHFYGRNSLLMSGN